ncbi:MAG: hypothetical protein LLG20_22840 [Acidobacteriales bacterium]|nr:hypothetical protein [Terriglobales bacterium]
MKKQTNNAVPLVPLARLVRPSDVAGVQLGWHELEVALDAILKICVSKGNSFEECFMASEIDSDTARDGFAALIAQGLLVQPDLGGRGGPCLFCLSDELVEKCKPNKA